MKDQREAKSLLFKIFTVLPSISCCADLPLLYHMICSSHFNTKGHEAQTARHLMLEAVCSSLKRDTPVNEDAHVSVLSIAVSDETKDNSRVKLPSQKSNDNKIVSLMQDRNNEVSQPILRKLVKLLVEAITPQMSSSNQIFGDCNNSKKRVIFVGDDGKSLTMIISIFRTIFLGNAPNIKSTQPIQEAESFQPTATTTKMLMFYDESANELLAMVLDRLALLHESANQVSKYLLLCSNRF